jgi:nucleoside 2-deoxyribosyltransferase
MKLYIAANFRDRAEISKLMRLAEARGHFITCDWTKEASPPQDSQEFSAFRTARALEDLDGVRAADAMVLIDHEHGKGMYVEMGVAIERQKPVVVVAQKYPQIFFSLPNVTHAADFEAALALLEERYCTPVGAALDAALKPKRSTQASKPRREANAKARKEEWAAIREAVLKRADGKCESPGCGFELGMLQQPHPLEVDHFFGGTGRRRALQSVETCWALCRRCHRLKTANEPSAAYWLEDFIPHCARYGYSTPKAMALGRLSGLQLQGRAS